MSGEIGMRTSSRIIVGVGSSVVTIVLAGCGGSDLATGLPKDVGYVAPKMQPGTAGLKTNKPKLGATEKDKADAKAKAAAEPAATPTP
jgi:hypothetical protein